MPNWCYDVLRVKGNRKQLDQFLEFVFAGETLFKRVVSYPQCLIELDRLGEIFGELVPEKADEYRKFVLEQVEAVKDMPVYDLFNHETTLMDRLLNGSQRFLENIMNWKSGLGYNLAGYDWCIRNWGTKWDVPTNEIQSVDYKRSTKLTFETAWSPPTKIVFALSTQYPRLRFNLRYYEMGMGFQGQYLCKDGQVLRDDSWEYRGNKGG